eukprot:TRINITY_DN6861_c0_g1_i1.p1 TRINITY_DN6861_c0_g1~~TRINITY_DN6861_c0_g1_i1.p1  ORF type:complete len:2128 (+),score=575.85 TRINITY_DN6861_c0_g1_i1:58-6441(+)
MAGQDWESLGVRQLRKECLERGIDLSGCFEKHQILKKLLAATGAESPAAHAAGSSQPRPEPAVQETSQRPRPEPAVQQSSQRGDAEQQQQQQQDGNALRPDPSAQEPSQTPAARVTPASTAGTGGAQQLDGMTMKQLRALCQARGIDITGCWDKASVLTRLKADPGEGGLPAGQDTNIQRRTGDAEQQQQQQQDGNALRPDPSAQEPSQTPAARVTPASTAGTGGAQQLDGMTMKQLRALCQARGIDITGCWDKADPGEGGLPAGQDTNIQRRTIDAEDVHQTVDEAEKFRQENETQHQARQKAERRKREDEAAKAQVLREEAQRRNLEDKSAKQQQQQQQRQQPAEKQREQEETPRQSAQHESEALQPPNWGAMSMRELRREGVLRRVDLTGLMDKESVIAKLEEAFARQHAARPNESSPDEERTKRLQQLRAKQQELEARIQAEENQRQADEEQRRRKQEERRLEEERAKQLQDAEQRRRKEQEKRRLEEERAKQLRELREQRELQAKRDEEDRKHQEEKRLQIEQQLRQEEQEKRRFEDEQAKELQQHREQQKFERNTQTKKPEHGVPPLGEFARHQFLERNLNRASGECNVQISPNGGLFYSDGRSLETVPMRTLIKECKLLSINHTGCYAKCEVIAKLRHALCAGTPKAAQPAATTTTTTGNPLSPGTLWLHCDDVESSSQKVHTPGAAAPPKVAQQSPPSMGPETFNMALDDSDEEHCSDNASDGFDFPAEVPARQRSGSSVCENKGDLLSRQASGNSEPPEAEDLSLPEGLPVSLSPEKSKQEEPSRTYHVAADPLPFESEPLLEEVKPGTANACMQGADPIEEEVILEGPEWEWLRMTAEDAMSAAAASALTRERRRMAAEEVLSAAAAAAALAKWERQCMAAEDAMSAAEASALRRERRRMAAEEAMSAAAASAALAGWERQCMTAEDAMAAAVACAVERERQRMAAEDAMLASATAAFVASTEWEQQHMSAEEAMSAAAPSSAATTAREQQHTATEEGMTATRSAASATSQCRPAEDVMSGASSNVCGPPASEQEATACVTPVVAASPETATAASPEAAGFEAASVQQALSAAQGLSAAPGASASQHEAPASGTPLDAPLPGAAVAATSEAFASETASGAASASTKTSASATSGFTTDIAGEHQTTAEDQPERVSPAAFSEAATAKPQAAVPAESEVTATAEIPEAAAAYHPPEAEARHQAAESNTSAEAITAAAGFAPDVADEHQTTEEDQPKRVSPAAFSEAATAKPQAAEPAEPAATATATIPEAAASYHPPAAEASHQDVASNTSVEPVRAPGRKQAGLSATPSSADGVKIGPDAPRAFPVKASISQLFRLTPSELSERCQAFGVDERPDEPKGTLISRLRQAMSAAAAAAPATSADDETSALKQGAPASGVPVMAASPDIAVAATSEATAFEASSASAGFTTASAGQRQTTAEDQDQSPADVSPVDAAKPEATVSAGTAADTYAAAAEADHVPATATTMHPADDSSTSAVGATSADEAMSADGIAQAKASASPESVDQLPRTCSEDAGQELPFKRSVSNATATTDVPPVRSTGKGGDASRSSSETPSRIAEEQSTSTTCPTLEPEEPHKEAESVPDTPSNPPAPEEDARAGGVFDFDDLDELDPPKGIDAGGSSEGTADNSKFEAKGTADNHNWEALSARELRQECLNRGIDLSGCFQKHDMLKRLSQSQNLSAAASDPEARAACKDAKGAADNSKFESNGTADSLNWEAMSVRELKKECLERGIDISGCFQKQDMLKKIRASSAGEGPPADSTKSSRPSSKPAAKEPTAKPAARAAADSTAETSKPSPKPAVKEPTSKPAAADPTGTGSEQQGEGRNLDSLLKLSTKELLQMAKSRGVDVVGCVEKSDIVERLTRAPPKVTVTGGSQSSGRTSTGASAPKAKAAPSGSRQQNQKAPPGRQQSWRAEEPPAGQGAPQSAHGQGQAPSPAAATHRSTGARAATAPAGADNLTPDASNWSPRLQTWFTRYPGFSAHLPPEAEMWADQELDVYFGSNGDIWPRGKRPNWFGKQGSSDAKSASPEPQATKTYPDLKPHFQTLDLAETTPHDIIRRHYRRMARDCHPDKHPDNVEEATKKFQKITEAYEAIASRVKF